MITAAFLATAITLFPAVHDHPAPRTADAERAKKALEKLADRHASAKTLRGNFEQQIHTPLAKKPLRSTGTLFFRRDPACAVFVIDKPRRSIVRFDDTSYRVHRPEEKKAETFLFGDDDLAGSFVRVFAPSKGEMEKVFAIIRTEEFAPSDSNLPKLLEVTLAPKQKKLQAHFTQLALTVDP
ncbi:MAG: outer membrane lipoprotein carrier protein LolA, partial [Planctomycetota bacterium]